MEPFFLGGFSVASQSVSLNDNRIFLRIRFNSVRSVCNSKTVGLDFFREIGNIDFVTFLFQMFEKTYQYPHFRAL